MSVKVYDIVASKKFKHDLRLLLKRGCDMALLDHIVTLLASGKALPTKNRDHALNGVFKGCRECHVAPDWLLIYEVDGQELFLYLTRTGSHSDLFKK